MTAPDPRLDEIQARAERAAEWSWSVRNIADEDRAYLLAELRKAHEALERVEGLAETLEASHFNENEFMSGRGSGFRIAGVRIRQTIRAAVAAAKGDEE